MRALLSFMTHKINAYYTMFKIIPKGIFYSVMSMYHAIKKGLTLINHFAIYSLSEKQANSLNQTIITV